MARSNGSAARTLEFVETAALGRRPVPAGGLRLVVPARLLQGPDKYRVLDHRRRQAQIKARHVLAALDSAD